MQTRQKEILRYLGYRGAPAEMPVIEQIDRALQETEAILSPKTVHRRFPCTVLDEKTVQIGSLRISSRTLARHLKGCGEAFLIAATLGVQADSLMQRYSVREMGYTVILQAVCAARIEEVCDTLELSLLNQVRGESLFLRPRFSPGYGDFPMEHQKEVIQLLDATRRIGLTVTDSLMMVPTKSVTAVVGLTTDGTGCHTVKCEACSQRDCPFRKG